MKKDMFKWTCLAIVIIIFAVSLYAYIRINRYEQVGSMTYDKWEGRYIYPYAQ